MADQQATYSVKVDTGDAKTSSTEAADALEKLRANIVASQSSIKGLGDSLRSLRGTTAEVTAAKDKLRAAIEAERSSISAANLALLKQGSSFTDLQNQVKRAEAIQRAYTAAVAQYQEKLRSDAVKKAAEEAKRAAADAAALRNDAIRKAAEEAKKAAADAQALNKSIGAAGGPVSGLRAKFEELKGALSTTGGALALFAEALVGIVVLAAKVVGAIASLTASLLEFILVGADAARTAMLQREAWTGSAAGAVALGHQIDALARIIPTAKAELQKLSGEVLKALNNSRISGQGIVDTFNAVAQASAAMGDDVGRRFQAMIERSKNVGRVVINPFELQGTGLGIQDIGKQLALLTGVSLAAANRALTVGGVNANLFAQALRKAAEVRFGDVNARQMLSLNVLAEKFRENLAALTKDIHLDALLAGFKEIADLFSITTVSGSVLKSTLETIANTLGPMFTAAIPSVKELFEYVELGVLKILTAMYRARNAIEDAFADQKNPITMAEVLGAIEHHIDGIVEGTVALIAIGTRMGITLGKAFYDVRDAVIGVKAFLDQGWEAVGTQIVQGIITGITGGISLVTSAITNLGTQIKKAFTDSLGIHSPSKVFEEYGAQTAAGYEAGADRGAPMAQAAADRMAPGAPNGGRQSSAGGGGRSVVVNVHLHGMSEHAVEKAKDASFLEGLTKAIEDALVAAGVGPQSEPT